MIRRLPDSALFRLTPSGLEAVSDSTIDALLDGLADPVADPAGTLPSCPLSQLEQLEAV